MLELACELSSCALPGGGGSGVPLPSELQNFMYKTYPQVYKGLVIKKDCFVTDQNSFPTILCIMVKLQVERK